MLIIISSTYGTKLGDSYTQKYRNETQNASFGGHNNTLLEYLRSGNLLCYDTRLSM
jgi:hypothetical protein